MLRMTLEPLPALPFTVHCVSPGCPFAGHATTRDAAFQQVIDHVIAVHSSQEKGASS